MAVLLGSDIKTLAVVTSPDDTVRPEDEQVACHVAIHLGEITAFPGKVSILAIPAMQTMGHLSRPHTAESQFQIMHKGLPPAIQERVAHTKRLVMRDGKQVAPHGAWVLFAIDRRNPLEEKATQVLLVQTQPYTSERHEDIYRRPRTLYTEEVRQLTLKALQIAESQNARSLGIVAFGQRNGFSSLEAGVLTKRAVEEYVTAHPASVLTEIHIMVDEAGTSSNLRELARLERSCISAATHMLY